jgi:hypothetical protein
VLHGRVLDDVLANAPLEERPGGRERIPSLGRCVTETVEDLHELSWLNIKLFLRQDAPCLLAGVRERQEGVPAELVAAA